MPDAFETLRGNSTAAHLADAWVHLNNQEGGGATTLTIYGEIEVELMADLHVIIESDYSVEIEDNQYDVELEPEFEVEVC